MSHRALVADTAKNAWPGFQIIEKIVKKHWFAAIRVFEAIQVVLVNGKNLLVLDGSQSDLRSEDIWD